MATILKRSIASIPARTASATWEVIALLLAPDPNSPGRAELNKVAGVACSSIASEATKDDAIVVSGNGPQVRIYCIFGEGAVSGDDVNEEAFQKTPTEGDWAMSIPCLDEDLAWTQKALKSCSTRVTARAVGEKIAAREDKNEAGAGNEEIEINVAEFLKS